MKILMVDVGGTNVKLMTTGKRMRRFASGPRLTARQMVAQALELTSDWKYDVVALGYPGRVIEGRPVENPGNLGNGWVRFDYKKAFGKPVRIINDAVMQALGKYRGGRMMFLGLGTSIGATLIVHHEIMPLNLGTMRYPSGRTFAQRLSKKALKTKGRRTWRKAVYQAVEIVREIFDPADIVIGGGNAKKLKPFPPGCRKGENRDAFAGAKALWRD